MTSAGLVGEVEGVDEVSCRKVYNAKVLEYAVQIDDSVMQYCCQLRGRQQLADS